MEKKQNCLSSVLTVRKTMYKISSKVDLQRKLSRTVSSLINFKQAILTVCVL